MDRKPFLLKPAAKDYLWGGSRLNDDFSKNIDMQPLAETWECSTHPDGPSVIASGEFEGMELAELLRRFPEFIGEHPRSNPYLEAGELPILIKFIDAKKDLSVQVHPDDEYALEVEGEYGKNEVWYILDCEPGASLYCGLKRKTTKEEIRDRIANNTITEILNEVKVKKGDVVFIKAGTIHAIGAGILICEIQQNSNTTYRIYDYGRVGADGKPRQLHIDKAVDVTNLCPAKPYPQSEPVDMGGWTKKRLAKCEYFTVDVINVDTSAALEADKSSFVNILVLDGGCVLSSEGNDAVELKKGDSVFIPAGLGKFELTGKCSAVMTHID